MSNLLPDSLKAILPPSRSTESQGDDAIAYAKYDLMEATLYATELEFIPAYHDATFDVDWPDTWQFFGWIESGNMSEWSYFTLDDLEYEDAVRDETFQPKSIADVKKEIANGSQD